MHTFCYTLVIVVMLESEVERSFGALIEVTFRGLVRTVAVSLEVVRSILELQQLLVRNRTVALNLLPVSELSKFSVDAQIRRVYSAVFFVEKRFDVVQCTNLEENVQPIDFHVDAMAVFAVFLRYVAEKAAVRTLCLRAIVLVVTFRVALGAYVLRAFEVTTRLVP